ncbi:MAG TPA: energy-coupling factor transporter transmembrane protein EcfT [Tissierellia bacterium]|nr:energy-coupling factor transporter transmembrane protein EcfT [Tissierellia bacterium]
MIRDITIGQYYPADSILHQLDPRVKLFATLVYIITIFVASTFVQYALITLFVFMLIRLSQVPFKFMVKGIKPILFVIIFAFLMNIFFTRGTPIFSVWRISIAKEGIEMAFLMAARLILLIIGTSLLTLTSSPIRLTDGLEKAFSPLKKIGFPAHELAMMMTIALRFIPTLLEETDKIMKAQQARGADFESGNIFRRAKSLIPLLVPLFIAAFKRADELANAMEARGYRGGEGRTKLNPLIYQRRDYIAYGLILLFPLLIFGIGKLL